MNLTKASIVLVGGWNSAIIEPNWLRQQFPDLISEAEFALEFGLNPQPSVRFVVEGILVEPTNARLSLSAKNFDQPTLDRKAALALGIVTRLPHTPIIAAGLNFAFTLNETENVRLFERNADNLRALCSELDLQPPASSKIQYSFPSESHVLNLTSSQSSKASTLDFNFHYTVSNREAVEKALREYAQRQEFATNAAKALSVSVP